MSRFYSLLSESIEERLLNSGALPVLGQYLELKEADERLYNMALLCVDSLLDCGEFLKQIVLDYSLTLRTN